MQGKYFFIFASCEQLIKVMKFGQSIMAQIASESNRIQIEIVCNQNCLRWGGCVWGGGASAITPPPPWGRKHDKIPCKFGHTAYQGRPRFLVAFSRSTVDQHCI